MIYWGYAIPILVTNLSGYKLAISIDSTKRPDEDVFCLQIK